MENNQITKPMKTKSASAVTNFETVLITDNQDSQTSYQSISTVELEDAEKDNAEPQTKKAKWYPQHFRDSWKIQYDWLVPENTRQGKRCVICNIAIVGGKSHIERHRTSDGHKTAEEIKKKTIQITNFTKADSEINKISNSAKKFEIAISMFIADHNLPFTALNHLNLCLKNHITDSQIIKKMTLNRIKGQNIIKTITGPANLEEISQITQNQYYSLIVDESTDCSVSKHLALVIRVFKRTSQDRFLGLIALEDSTSQGIFDCIVKILNEKGIPLHNMVGFTSDNCNVMMGSKNGVQAKLKEIIPKLFVNGCICHILNLVSVAASAKLPHEIDQLIREINHHFCNSSTRKTEFNKFQEEFGIKLHVILRYSSTRWLSRQAAIERIIEQWIPLTYYFELSDFERGYGNENISFISTKLKDKQIKMYFLFLSYVLKMINNVNLEMQSEQPRMHVFLPRLKYLFKAIARNFIKKEALDRTSIKLIDLETDNLNDNNLYCGADVEIYSKTVSDPTIIKDFKFNVRQFYIKFCHHLRTKINFDNDVLEIIPKFSPEHVLLGETNSILNLLVLMFPDKEMENAELINTEYRALSEFEELKQFKHLSIVDFWTEVGSIKNELGSLMFPNIFRIAQGILSLPHSSANVERIFSIQNLIKSKCRNRLAVSTCGALIQTRDLLKSSNSECYNYKISSEMLSKKCSDNLIDDAMLLD